MLPENALIAATFLKLPDHTVWLEKKLFTTETNSAFMILLQAKITNSELSATHSTVEKENSPIT